MAEPMLHVYGNTPHGSRRKELTVKEYARLERVTERTVWNWKEKGAIVTRRTPGGGVRVIVSEND